MCSFPPEFLIFVDPSTLSVVKMHTIGYWVVKMKLLGRISDTIDQFVAITSINEIIIFQFDHTDMSWILRSHTISLDPRGSGVQASIEICEDDKSLFAACFDEILALYRITPSHLVCLERLSVTGPYIEAMKFYGSEYITASTFDYFNILKVPVENYFGCAEGDTHESGLVCFDSIKHSSITDLFTIDRTTTKSANDGSFDIIFSDTKNGTFALVSVRIEYAHSNKVCLCSSIETFLLSKSEESVETYSRGDSIKVRDELSFDVWLPFGPEDPDIAPCFSIITPNDKLILSYRK